MATFLAVFSIISGTASVLGLYHVFKGENQIKFKRVTIGSFVFAILVSLYIIFVPGNYFENSVKSKIQHYSKSSSDSIMVQKGEFSYGGTKPYAIMFPEPFSQPPTVEIINVNGYDDQPYVSETTEFQVIVDRSRISAGFIPQSMRTFIWVAKGEPLNAIEK
ncbi:TPA: hypothetical protein NG614_000055 [Vibrio parahaemolyticus]|nr:hypothetical protein [Vibrio parahaemolyticus]